MDNNFLSLIKTRRSVRAYKSEFVPSEALDAVLEAGVPSRFMRKFVCRLRLNEVSRQ